MTSGKDFIKEESSEPSYNYFAFIPTYVGSVMPGKSLTWAAPCFKKSVYSLTANSDGSYDFKLDLSEY